MNDRRRLGWALAASGMLLVSTDSYFVRLSRADGVDMAFLVAVFALPVYLVCNRFLEEVSLGDALRRRTRPLLAVGVLSSISQICFIVAVTKTDVSNVVVIVASMPIMAALLAWAFLGERTSSRVWMAISVTVVGVLVVVSGSLGSANVEGDALALVAIAAFAVSVNVWRRYGDMSRFVGLAISAALMIVATAPFADPFSQDLRVYLSAAAMGIVFNTAGRACHTNASRFAPTAEVALFTPVETVAATVWAWIGFSERPSTATVVGGIIVVAGVTFGTLSAARQPAVQPTSCRAHRLAADSVGPRRRR